jgi:hypothetical protein
VRRSSRRGKDSRTIRRPEGCGASEALCGHSGRARCQVSCHARQEGDRGWRPDRLSRRSGLRSGPTGGDVIACRLPTRRALEVDGAEEPCDAPGFLNESSNAPRSTESDARGPFVAMAASDLVDARGGSCRTSCHNGRLASRRDDDLGSRRSKARRNAGLRPARPQLRSPSFRSAPVHLGAVGRSLRGARSRSRVDRSDRPRRSRCEPGMVGCKCRVGVARRHLPARRLPAGPCAGPRLIRPRPDVSTVIPAIVEINVEVRDGLLTTYQAPKIDCRSAAANQPLGGGSSPSADRPDLLDAIECRHGRRERGDAVPPEHAGIAPHRPPSGRSPVARSSFAY